MSRLPALLAGSPFAGYLYSYPHKTAYRPLRPAIPLRELWAPERRDALFLYVHIPFCAIRCGFCNLFTSAQAGEDLVEAYLAALARQAQVVKDALGEARFARFALGGGTPTFLEPDQLERAFDVATSILGAELPGIPASVEVSPETTDAARLRVLRARGVDRVSIGVQSFVEEEVKAVNRPQRTAEVEAALDLIRAEGFPTLNVDLMYGLPGQTEETWIHSLDAALRHRPEEIYLYPLYVRPVTALSRSPRSWDDERLALYRLGRDVLRERGYTQVSMRMFRAAHAPEAGGPVYSCQADGMVGLGCGARSYTQTAHYGSTYAVGASGVRDVIAAWVKRDEAAFAHADHGFLLDPEERRRRHVILSLLSEEGLDLRDYAARFGSDPGADLPLAELLEHGLAGRENGTLRLTPLGIERSDTIGPWLHSERVRGLMGEYAWA